MPAIPSFQSVLPPSPTYRRALYAADPTVGRGRRVPESPSASRTDFQRDRDRILHSTAFRRLANKTQVFVLVEGDAYRTRLTHTIEVGQIARALARALGLDDDLAEALALAHDLGHPPFGHTGEDALAAAMAPYGGFDHNAQALRIVTSLERRYAAFDGLNLTWDTLEGLVKHNGPLRSSAVIPAPIAEFDAVWPLELDKFPSAEAQAAALADDIAYNGHDLDDGLRAGLFSLRQAEAIPFLADLLADVRAAHPDLEQNRVIHELVRRVITRFVEDAIAESSRRIEQLRPASIEAIRGAEYPVIGFSAETQEAVREIKAFLLEHMYRAPQVMPARDAATRVVAQLFAKLLAEPRLMPPEWQAMADAAQSEPKRTRVVADYIAGMTDRYAVTLYHRFFDDTVDLR
ncbi:MAG: deoxyguanosinetriphosphate triphosphohydrolase [Methylobacteriaceae bacterium]|nr:deoxyguanosinetriphosphate triphosphohydrolase [Methylobacteriaceae bacterium]MBV9394503.1 deoxyguanosinetriphosphate triphosphohydrolase [Methylobacteriaceae bacterium]